MNSENPYEPSKSAFEVNTPKVQRDETRGRRAYLFQLFMVWIILPLLATYVARTFDLDSGAISETAERNTSNEKVGSIFHFDIMYAWYLQCPLFIYFTRGRVIDAGLNPWLTILFILPIINIAMWFWPPKYR